MYYITCRYVDKQTYNNIYTRIDTNEFKFKNVDKEKYSMHAQNIIYQSKYLENFY